MERKILFILLSVLSFFLITSCAGTREEEDGFYTEEEKQQKELDDIEALLGISNEEEKTEQPKSDEQSTPKEETVAKKEEPAGQGSEKLDLLSNNEMINTSAGMGDETEDLQKKVAKLENDLRKKEMEIVDLRAQVTVQEEQLKNRPTQSSSGPVSSISMEEYQSRYDEARAYFEARDYATAIQYFESLLAASTNHSLSDNAQYWIGECHYAQRQYDSAIIDFEKVFTFAKSNKSDAAQLKLGLCYLRKGEKQKAQEELNRLLRNYPDSDYTSYAERVLNKL